MTWVGAALWGLFGGFAAESVEFWTAVRRYGRWPWEDPDGGPSLGPLAYVIATVLRLGVGAGVAAAASASAHSAVTAWVAMVLGAAAPVLLEKGIVLSSAIVRGSVTALTEAPPYGSHGSSAMHLVPAPPDGPPAARRAESRAGEPGQLPLPDGEGQGS